MANFNLNNKKKIHMIGIAGTSMSGIADILLSMGFSVTGSDRVASEVTDRLEKQGIKVIIGHFPENVHGADVVVYTAAIKEDNPEILEAKKLNIELVERSEFLGQITKAYSDTIAVSGTHGKTTTTSMITSIFLKAQKDPTVQVGADLDILNNMNYRVGNSDFLIVEACEYVRSFLKFYPKVDVILNVEEDHLDYYKDIDDIKSAFNAFADIPNEDGYIIVNADNDNALEVAKNHKASVITFATNNSDADYVAQNIALNNNGAYSFDVICKKNNITIHILLNVPGFHNVYNALAAIATSKIYGINDDDIKSALESFHGAKRRFEYVGDYKGASIYDDYAHHPTEIKATIEAAHNILTVKNDLLSKKQKSYATEYATEINSLDEKEKTKPHKLWVVFQPHTYTRTYALFNDFVTAFDKVDNVIVTDIYAAREKDTGLVSSKDLANKINEYSKNCTYCSTLEAADEYLLNNVSSGDLILTIGAGTITKLGRMMLKSLQE